MPSMRIVNASPLIFLSQVGLLEALREPGLDVVVPEAVANEIRALGHSDPAVRALDELAWLTIRPAPPAPEVLATFLLDPG